MDSERIGIMADSHGEVDAIGRAIDLFQAQACVRWIHLGDICDTARPDTARACLDLLATPRASVLCGNNENALRLNIRGRPDDGLRARLAALPLTLTIANVMLAHALPYADRLGASCTLGAMDPHRARAFFDRYPGCHLIRGHDHQPECIQWVNARLVSELPVPGQTYRLEARRPSILTTGALTAGWVLVWDRSTASVQYLHLE